MNRRLGTDWSNRESHPSEEDLLYYVDGELPPREAASVREHLEACWTCRVRTEQVQETISSFVRFLTDSITPNLRPPASGWKPLNAQMARVAAEANTRPLLLQWLDAWRKLTMLWPLPRTLTLAALWSLLVFLLVFRVDRVPPVSANQLIQNAAEFQDRQLHAVAQPVVHQKLRIRRTVAASHQESSVAWELWNDAGHHRFRQQAEDASGRRVLAASRGAAFDPHDWTAGLELGDAGVSHQTSDGPAGLPRTLAELTQILLANRMDPRRPLSAESFEAWRESVPGRSEAVKESSLADGSKALTLTTEAPGPFRANAIIQTQLVVRGADWHPIEQRLKVQGERGILNYSLTETAFEVLPLSALPPLLFADLVPPPIPKPPAPVVPASPTIIPPVPVPTPADLADAEVEALFVLHRAKVCLGGRVSVVRSDADRIAVQGVVESAERRDEILTGLQSIPWITTEIQTADDTLSPAPNPEGSAEVAESSPSMQVVTLGVQSGKLPIQDLLEEYFAQGHPGALPAPGDINHKITELSNRAVLLSESALDEAWALRHLTESVTTLKTDDLRPSLRYALEVMVHDHLTALQAQMGNSRQLLEPVLVALLDRHRELAVGPSAGNTFAVPDSENSNWISSSHQLFATVEQIDRLTLALFADTSVPPARREAAMQELLAAMGGWDTKFQDLEAAVAKAFPGKPGSFTLNSPPE